MTLRNVHVFEHYCKYIQVYLECEMQMSSHENLDLKPRHSVLFFPHYSAFFSQCNIRMSREFKFVPNDIFKNMSKKT